MSAFPPIPGEHQALTERAADAQREGPYDALEGRDTCERCGELGVDASSPEPPCCRFCGHNVLHEVRSKTRLEPSDFHAYDPRRGELQAARRYQRARRRYLASYGCGS